MKPINIKRELCSLPTPGEYTERVYAKDQPPYIPLPSVITADGKFMTMWQPDANDLELLKNGAPVTITLLHTPYVDPRVPLLPMRVEVGGTDLR